MDSTLDADSYFWLKRWFGNDFRQCVTPKKRYFTLLHQQMPLRNSITMATAKVPIGHTIFEIVCSMLIRKVTKFQFDTPDSF